MLKTIKPKRSVFIRDWISDNVDDIKQVIWTVLGMSAVAIYMYLLSNWSMESDKKFEEAKCAVIAENRYKATMDDLLFEKRKCQPKNIKQQTEK